MEELFSRLDRRGLFQGDLVLKWSIYSALDLLMKIRLTIHCQRVVECTPTVWSYHKYFALEPQEASGLRFGPSPRVARVAIQGSTIRRIALRKSTSLSVMALLASFLCWGPAAQPLHAQNKPPDRSQNLSRGETTQDYNGRLERLRQSLAGQGQQLTASEYRIGAQDLLEITVFEAPELNRSVRVSASGEISLPLLGGIKAAGLTPREFELVVEELLRKSYLKDPHVGVFVREMQSHPVSVFGAVKKPGVFQIGGAKTLVEVLSMAEGLGEDAGDTVIVMRGAGLPSMAQPTLDAPPAEGKVESPIAGTSPATEETGGNTVQINLKNLLESGDARDNVIVYPGDVVKVTRAGVVYVVGEVKKPGGFMLKTNENITALQAVAMAEGLTRTSAKSRARIIRTDESSGARTEIPINLDKILAGRIADPLLLPKDIVFVPNSAGKSALYGSTQGIVSAVGGAAVYRW
jgi:polysaccharide biosynthesis/export protein